VAGDGAAPGCWAGPKARGSTKVQATTASATNVVVPYQTTGVTRGRYPGTCLHLTGTSRATAESA
jgi:hypothetical protein